jgi:excinuclease UvrABC helicase subunit UvrB
MTFKRGATMKKSQMKKIYKQVAKKHGITPEEVEREISETLKFAWLHENTPSQAKEAQNQVPRHGSVPTNEEFINYIAEKVKKSTDLP